LKPAPEGGGKGQDYLVAESSEWLNSLVRHKAALAPASLGPLAVRQHDKQTLIFGDVTPVREFLLADGKPKQLSQAAPATPANQGLGSGPTAGLGGGPTAGLGGGPTATTGGAPGGREEGSGTGQNSGTVLLGKYLTIPSHLKALMDRLERQPTLI